MKTQDLRITEINFDLIKQNLINFLKSQSEFSGYNFEGSALNVLLDVLAYNTYYQAFYNNMTVNEMFLDSATKRSSIVSIAKHFSYRPKTMVSSRVVVDITTTDISNTMLPRGTKITASRGGKSYSFVCTEDTTLVPSEFDATSGGVSKLSTGPVTFVQGNIRKYSFVADAVNTSQKFVIPFLDVDASTLRVSVQPDSSVAVFEEYTEATNITTLNSDSSVFFIEENADGYLELIFGDGILGKGLSDGNVIRIEVVESVGSAADGIGIVNSASIFGGPNTISESLTRVLVPSTGGASKETKETIRFNTTRNFVTQERAVTKEDYKNILLSDFPILEDVMCWGGEDNAIPQYGVVFITVKPKTGAILSSNEKKKIIQTLTETRNVVGVRVEFVDPEVLYLNLTVNLKIDPINLASGTNQLLSDIRQEVYDYTDKNLNKFDKDFYATDLSSIIQQINRNIISNEINVSIEKRFTPTFDNRSHSYEINFNNELYHPIDGYTTIINSNVFGYVDSLNIDRDCRIIDNGNGVLKLVYDFNDTEVVVKSNIGTIDYTTGKLTLKNFKPSSLIDNLPISLFAVPNERDIIAKQKMFLIHEQPSSISLTTNITLVPYRNR